tara:strand:- start:346 stop:501 length:156 start_codon:yes stop_codon:yes gene_type:complete
MVKKKIPTFSIQIEDMFSECKNENKAKVKRWKLKQWLIKKNKLEQRSKNGI